MKKLLIFIPFLLFAEILSPLQKELLKNEKDKVIVSGDELKDSWIKPITLQYKYNQTDQTPTLQKTNSFIISINQPIFKSGAIWASLKYARFLKEENLKKVELKKAELIKKIYEIVLQIKKIDISIKKENYLIKNADIEIKRKKEQFLNGVSDSSFLDNAIIKKNNLLLVLNDLKKEKEILKNRLSNLTTLQYQDIKIPKLKIVSEKEYLNNFNIQIAKKRVDVKNQLKKMTIGDNLLSISFITNYNVIKTEYNKETLLYQNSNKKFYNIGLSLKIPLDINSFKRVEEKKLEYLDSVLNYKESLIEAKNSYYSQINEIDSINRKIKIYENSIKNYNSLIKITKDNVIAGINSRLDLENLENSLEIAKLNKNSLELEKVIKILNLYYLVKGFK